MHQQDNTITIPIKQVKSKSNITTETLLYNITKRLNTNNTANINYCIGGTNNNPLEPLGPLFCDNIILYYYITPQQILLSNTLKDYVNGNTVKRDLLDKEISNYLAENTLKIKRVLTTLLESNINKTNIKPTTYTKEGEQIKQYIKVSLADIPLNNVINVITNNNAINTLQANGLFIGDVDLTRDYAGLINKEEVINYLVEEHNYVLADEDNNLDYNYIILDN